MIDNDWGEDPGRTENRRRNSRTDHLASTPEEAVRLCLAIFERARAMEREEHMKIFQEPEVGFIAALAELGWRIVERE
jgi:hypothetical protein